MNSVSSMLRLGMPCGEDKCKIMNRESGCLCFMAAEEIDNTKVALYNSERLVDNKIEALYALAAERDELEAEVQRLREGLVVIAEDFPRPEPGLTDFGEREHYLWIACRLRKQAQNTLNSLDNPTRIV